MPSPVPTPVAAALGVVPIVFDGVRRLPSKALHLPVRAIGTALNGVLVARREYEALAERGERMLAGLRGRSFDQIEDRVEDAVAGTPLAQPYDLVEDALENVADRARAAAGSATRATGKGLDRAADAVEEAASTVAETAAPSEKPDPAEEPKGAPTPKASEPDTTRVDTAASASVVAAVEQVSSTLGGEVLPHAALPLPDYDHLTLGSLRGRMRSLDLPQLVQIRDYEKAHADRLPIMTMLDNRIAKLAHDPSAPLSDAPPTAPVPAGDATPSPNGSRVSPVTAAPTRPIASHGGLGDQNRPR